jgi:hypothetical protein
MHLDRQLMFGLALGLAACSGDVQGGRAAEDAGSDEDGAGAVGDDGEDSADRARETGNTNLSDASFERPDTEAVYNPKAGDCGFAQPAFCDTFETIAKNGASAGELDPTRWSVTRAGPTEHASLDEAFAVGPTKLPTCRAGLPDRVLAPRDTLICDPSKAIPTRHLHTATAAQNYGLSSYRIRQAFDFAGRTGTIKFDVDLSNNGLGGWPALVIAEDPSPAPSFDWEERGSGPRNGVSIEFNGGWCNHPKTLEVALFTFRDYLQKGERASFDCDTPHVSTERDQLNHVEIYLTRKHLEVWASDPSPSGQDFPNFQKLYEAELDLPFERGYVHLLVRNHATMKYWVGSAWSVRWDNVGFDGPLQKDVREFSASEPFRVAKGLDGCMIGGACRWRGDVIAENAEVNKGCETSCKFDGEGSVLGYVVPRDDEPPARIEIPDVKLAGAKKARLALAATYPWFDWNGVSKPPTAIALRYRLNEGSWHARPISAVEANAYTDFSPELGGAGHGAGLLNQMIELDPAELREGSNSLELLSVGTWTGSYRAGVAKVELLLGSP